MESILAIDPARQTGFAKLIDGKLTSGTVDFWFSPDETLGAKLWRWKPWLSGMAGDVLVMERGHMRGGAASRQALGMEAIAELVSYENKSAIHYVHTGTLKKHATGHGKAAKDEIIAAAIAKWPDQEIADDNQADALWLMDYYLTTLAANGCEHGISAYKPTEMEPTNG